MWRPCTYALDDRFRWSKRNNQYGIEKYNRGSAVGASWSRRVLRLLACLLIVGIYIILSSIPMYINMLGLSGSSLWQY